MCYYNIILICSYQVCMLMAGVIKIFLKLAVGLGFNLFTF